MTDEQLQKAWVLRKLLHEMDDLQAIEWLLDKLRKGKTNEEFFSLMKKN